MKLPALLSELGPNPVITFSDFPLSPLLPSPYYYPHPPSPYPLPRSSSSPFSLPFLSLPLLPPVPLLFPLLSITFSFVFQ